MLKHEHTRIEEVQKRLQQLLPSDAILVGHSLNFDLDALQVSILLTFNLAHPGGLYALLALISYYLN